jgi:hypothetical protein
MNNKVCRYGTLFVVYASLAAPAFAYLDGATGSMILQALIGLGTTWLVYSRTFAARAKTFLKRISGRGDQAPTAES